MIRRLNQKPRRTALVALAGLAFLATACGEEQAAEVDLARPVVVTEVRVTDFQERIEAIGELAAKDHAEIASEVEGRITEIPVDEGTSVEEGALLLAIDPEKRELEVANARANAGEAAAAHAEAKRDADRAIKLHERGIASEAALDQASAELLRAASRLDSARAGVGVAERALRDANVRAPFAGLVARRHVSRGEYVRPGEVLFELVALDPIEVEFTVAERDSARVVLGQRVAVSVAPYPDETFEGEVTLIAPTIDRKTRTLRVEARIDNTDERLRPGLFARADLGVAQRPGVTMVPEEAVLQRAAGQVLYRVQGEDRAERLLVETGGHREGWVEIISGLEPGDWIIQRGHAGIDDGDLISLRDRDGKPFRSDAPGGVKVAADPGEAAEHRLQ